MAQARWGGGGHVTIPGGREGGHNHRVLQQKWPTNEDSVAPCELDYCLFAADIVFVVAATFVLQ